MTGQPSKSDGNTPAGFRLSAVRDRLCRPGARGGGESKLLSGGKARDTQNAQPYFGVVSLAVVPDEFASASFISCSVHIRQSKSQLQDGALSRTFCVYLSLPIIAFHSGATVKENKLTRDSASSFKTTSVARRILGTEPFPPEKNTTKLGKSKGALQFPQISRRYTT